MGKLPLQLPHTMHRCKRLNLRQPEGKVAVQEVCQIFLACCRCPRASRVHGLISG